MFVLSVSFSTMNLHHEVCEINCEFLYLIMLCLSEMFLYISVATMITAKICSLIHTRPVFRWDCIVLGRSIYRLIANCSKCNVLLSLLGFWLKQTCIIKVGAVYRMHLEPCMTFYTIIRLAQRIESGNSSHFVEPEVRTSTDKILSFTPVLSQNNPINSFPFLLLRSIFVLYSYMCLVPPNGSLPC